MFLSQVPDGDDDKPEEKEEDSRWGVAPLLLPARRYVVLSAGGKIYIYIYLSIYEALKCVYPGVGGMLCLRAEEKAASELQRWHVEALE